MFRPPTVAIIKLYKLKLVNCYNMHIQFDVVVFMTVYDFFILIFYIVITCHWLLSADCPFPAPKNGITFRQIGNSMRPFFWYVIMHNLPHNHTACPHNLPHNHTAPRSRLLHPLLCPCSNKEREKKVCPSLSTRGKNVPAAMRGTAVHGGT
jgi:hypothetical protein